jgi:lipopolysaccharide/colanic/teichoic acid biosynthesis glycosyltransferase
MVFGRQFTLSDERRIGKEDAGRFLSKLNMDELLVLDYGIDS